MNPASAANRPAKTRRDTLYWQVLVAIVLGVITGVVWPNFGAELKPLGDAFVRLVQMLIAPIIFATVVGGLASMGDLKKVGRVGLKAIVYFEVATTLALLVGLVVVNLIRPGDGFHATAVSLAQTGHEKEVAGYAAAAHSLNIVEFLLKIIPRTFVGAFAEGEILQVLLLAILCGFALARLGEAGRPVLNLIHQAAQLLFGVVAIVVRAAPIAAFGAMAFTVGKYGLHTLASLASLMACVYLTCLIFVFAGLGVIARVAGFSLWKILKLIREELFIVLGTSSSESALPLLMEKMEKIGCARPVVGIVVPAGYSFNLDGTCIYLTMAAIFIAQATDTPLALGQQLGLLGVLLLTSKGAAAVTGGGFITLAATLNATGHVPVAGLALILGVDRFMSEARALTNFVGNTVATLIVSKWEGAFDARKAGAILAGGGARPEIADTAAAAATAVASDE